jgi:F-type H+-transporting ATPase subunit a
MLVSWIAALGLIVFAQLATRKMQQVPRGAQNFLEWLVESLYGFLEGILGPHLVKRTFWFLQRFSFSYCAPTGLVLCREPAPLVGGHVTPHGFNIESALVSRRQC